MNQPLAIVGASVRAAAASAVRAGFQPITADLFADADLRAIATATSIAPYPEGLLDWLRAVDPPAWMYTGALENHPDLIDQMAWIAPLWGNAGDVLQRIRSPLELRTVLEESGLLFPETRTSAEGLPRDGSWLRKTYRGASGSGVFAWSERRGAANEDGVDLSCRAELGEGSDPVYQQRIVGDPCSAAFVAGGGTAAFLGITRQLIGEAWLGAHSFQYAGSIGLLTVSAPTREAIERLGNMLASKFELVGLFGVDFILGDNEQVWTLEVNPRYSASIEVIERATSLNAIAMHVDACRGLRVESRGSSAKSQGCHGKAILYARRDVVITEQFAAMAMTEATHRPWPTLADISPAGTPIDTGQPLLTVFADGSDGDEVKLRLRERVAEIERTLYSDEATT